MSKKSNKRRKRRRGSRRTMQGGAKVFAKGTIVRLSQKGVDDFLDWWMQLPEITQLIDHWVAGVYSDAYPEWFIKLHRATGGASEEALAVSMREAIRNQEIGKVRAWRGMVEGLTPDADLRILTPAQQRARTKGFGPTKTTAAGHTIHQYHRAGPPSIKARHYVWGGGRLLDGFRHWVAPQDYFLPAGAARDDLVPVPVHAIVGPRHLDDDGAVIRKHPLASDPNFSVAERAANRTRVVRAMAALPEGARGSAPGIAEHVAGFLDPPPRDPPVSLAERRRAAALGRVGTRRNQPPPPPPEYHGKLGDLGGGWGLGMAGGRRRRRRRTRRRRRRTRRRR